VDDVNIPQPRSCVPAPFPSDDPVRPAQKVKPAFVSNPGVIVTVVPEAPVPVLNEMTLTSKAIQTPKRAISADAVSKAIRSSANKSTSWSSTLVIRATR
jgi:hypothetical protein